jgi:hypothetical protein
MEKEWQDLEVESVGCDYYLSTEYYNQHNLN